MTTTPTAPATPVIPQPRPGTPANPPQFPPTGPFGPRPGVVSVLTRPCCGALPGDWCTCACLVTEARIVAALSKPIRLVVA